MNKNKREQSLCCTQTESLLVNRQFRSVMRLAGLNIWEYDYASRRLVLMCAQEENMPPSGLFFYPRRGGDLVVEDFPERMGLAFAGTLQNEAAIRRAWQEMHETRPMLVCCRLTYRDGRPLWLEIGCETLYAQDGRPLRDMGFFRDITKEKEREQEERAHQLLLQRLEQESLYSLRIDLTNDSVLRNPAGLKWLKDTGNDGTAGYSDCILKLCDTAILPRFQRQLRIFLHRDRLLEAFEAGNTSDRIEYQCLYGGRAIWCQLEYHLARQAETGDIFCYVFVMDIEARKRQEQLLRQRAEIDEQSGVYNRQAGFERIREALARTLRTGGTAGLLLCDLDDFKRINDTFGHACGDDAILGTGLLLRSIFTGRDISCRMGGDEFLIYCLGASRQDMEDKARRLVAGAREIWVGESSCTLSLSAGIAMVPDAGKDFETLYRLADALLYEAKNNGKDTYRML